MSTQKTKAVPAYLKKYQDQAADQAEKLADASTSVPRLSLKGKKFKLLEGGEELKKPSLELDVIILDSQPEGRNFIKTYYDGSFNPQDTAPPDCSSSNGVHPDGWVQNPQHHNCAQCPKNQFGSATSAVGKKAKACRDSKRLYITLPEAVGDKVFILNVPVTSLKNLAAFGRMIATEGYPLFAVITTLTFDDEQDYPVLMFTIKGFLKEVDGEKAFGLTQKHSWREKLEAPSSQKAIAQAHANDAGAKDEEPSATDVVTDVVEGDSEAPSGDIDDVAGEW